MALLFFKSLHVWFYPSFHSTINKCSLIASNQHLPLPTSAFCSTMSRVNKLEYTVLILFFLYAALLLLNMKWVVEFSNESVNISKIFAWESTYSKDFWFTYCKILEVGLWSQNLFPQKRPACIILCHGLHGFKGHTT